MILYIDLIIILNIIVNYIFIKTIKIIYKEKFTILEFFTSIFVTTISFSLFFIPLKYIYNLRYYVGILIGLCAFYKKDIKVLLIQIIMFYLLNISFIGTLVIFKIDNIILLFICILFVISLWFIESFKKDFIKSNNNIYKIKIGSKSYMGYYDSGNSSYCDNIPVIYIDNTYLSKEYKAYKEISVSTISGKTSVLVYNGPLLHLNNKDYIVYYAFIKSLGNKVILNKELGD